MKILVLSDSHGFKDYLLSAVETESPDMIFHLGDNKKDCEVVEKKYPQIPLRSVKGNCDTFSHGLDFDEFTLEGKRFFMTHGHLFGVKTDKAGILNSAFNRNADVLLFGHTHIPYYTVKDNLVVVNPGSLSSAEKNYAVLELKNGDVSCELKVL